MPHPAPAAAVPANLPLVAAVRTALGAVGDPRRAARQQRYLKSAMPSRGITSGELRVVLRPLLAEHRIAQRAEWEATVRALWDDSTFREERYAATALAGHRHYRSWQDSATMPLYEQLIVTGAWWDHVDAIATHLVGPIVMAHKDLETRRMLDWSVADDLWLRRTSIICQLTFKDATDVALLDAAIRANLEVTAYGGEFFIRKAIGWSLRQYARTDPEWVRGFVDAHRGRLSGLSVREALKHLAGP